MDNRHGRRRVRNFGSRERKEKKSGFVCVLIRDVTLREVVKLVQQ